MGASQTVDRKPSAFTDRLGRTWTIEGSLELFGRVRAETGVNLLDIVGDQSCVTQLRDPYLLGQVAYQLCAKQIAARGLTPEEFSGGFDGDVLEQIAAAILDEVIFFSPSRIRPALQTIVERSRAAEKRMAEITQSRLDEIGRQTDQALERLMKFSASATSSPESSASTPGPGPSANSNGPPTRGSAKTGTKPPRSSQRSTR